MCKQFLLFSSIILFLCFPFILGRESYAVLGIQNNFQYFENVSLLFTPNADCGFSKFNAYSLERFNIS